VSVTFITNLTVKHLQYFATGKAAENFARRQSVREAMVRRLDPVAAEISFAKSKASPSARIRVLKAVEMFLESADDPRAKPAVAEAQSALATLVAAEPPVNFYHWSTPQSVVIVETNFTARGSTGGDKLVSLWSVLTTSTKTLDQITALPNLNSLKRKDSPDRAFTAPELATLKEDMKTIPKRLADLNDRVASLPAVQKMMSVFAELTVGSRSR
jgi:hypothetical protein